MLTLGAALVWVTVSKEHVIDYRTSSDRPPLVDYHSPSRLGNWPVIANETSSETHTVTSSPKFVMSQAFTEDDVRALTTAISIVDGHRDALSPTETDQWSTVRARVDAIRKTIALSKYPSIADNYAAVVDDAAKGGKTELDRLSKTQRQDFMAVQRLLGESLPLR